MRNYELLMDRIKYCEKMTSEIAFDPFALLTGEESREQKLLHACNDFLTAIEKAYNDFSENARKVLYNTEEGR